jgi:hypothetical protein
MFVIKFSEKIWHRIIGLCSGLYEALAQLCTYHCRTIKSSMIVTRKYFEQFSYTLIVIVMM